jgi:hypothetical protein
MKVELCDDCRLAGGWHETRDENDELVLTRPHRDAALAQAAIDAEHAKAVELTRQALTNSYRQAMGIIRDKAQALPVLSANDCRPEMDAAQIPTAVIGAAFSRLARDGVLEEVDRVMANVSTTRHKIGVYRSLIYRKGAA